MLLTVGYCEGQLGWRFLAASQTYLSDDISKYAPYQGNAVGQEHGFQDSAKEEAAKL